jgi:hypothetical protein
LQKRGSKTGHFAFHLEKFTNFDGVLFWHFSRALAGVGNPKTEKPPCGRSYGINLPKEMGVLGVCRRKKCPSKTVSVVLLKVAHFWTPRSPDFRSVFWALGAVFFRRGKWGNLSTENGHFHGTRL